jgi:hypothetical protein
MSAQMQSYRWSDKPVAAKQALLVVLIGLITIVLVFRFKAKEKAKSESHAFTQSAHDHSGGQTAKDIAQSGAVQKGSIAKTSVTQSRGGGGSAASHSKNGIQERPLFDGLPVTMDVVLAQAISSSSGDLSAEANVLAILPSDGSQSSFDGMEGAKLDGQFQPNFESKRMQIQFRELVTPDGRRYSVSGVAMDSDGESIGVTADYSSGMGMRILGATLGTAISTAEVVVTSRVIENGAGADALVSSQLNQAITSSAQGATSTISDEATHDLKNTKPMLSLSAGTHFRVKLRQTAQTQTGGIQ